MPEIINSNTFSHEIARFLSENTNGCSLLNECSMPSIYLDDVTPFQAVKLSNESINQSDLSKFLSDHLSNPKTPPKLFRYSLTHHFIDFRPFLVSKTL